MSTAPTLLSNQPSEAPRKFEQILYSVSFHSVWPTCSHSLMLLIALTYMMTSCLQLYCLVHSTDAITWVNWSRRMIEVCLTGEKSSNVNLSSLKMVVHNIICHITRAISSTVKLMSSSPLRILLIRYSCYRITWSYVIVSMALKQLCSCKRMVHTLHTHGLILNFSQFWIDILVDTLHAQGTPHFWLH